jgi:hypothetical protein
LRESDQFLLCFRGLDGGDDKKSQDGRDAPQCLIGQLNPQGRGIWKTCLHVDLAELDPSAVLGSEATPDTPTVSLAVCPKRPETHSQGPEESIHNVQTGELD